MPTKTDLCQTDEADILFLENLANPCGDEIIAEEIRALNE